MLQEIDIVLCVSHHIKRYFGGRGSATINNAAYPKSRENAEIVLLLLSLTKRH